MKKTIITILLALVSLASCSSDPQWADEEAHEKIRADPSFVKKEKKEVEKKRFGKKRLTYAERKAALAAKKRKYGYPEGK